LLESIKPVAEAITHAAAIKIKAITQEVAIAWYTFSLK
jgi:hypothetical protein